MAGHVFVRRMQSTEIQSDQLKRNYSPRKFSLSAVVTIGLFRDTDGFFYSLGQKSILRLRHLSQTRKTGSIGSS